MSFILFDSHTAPIVNCTKVDKSFNLGESFGIARRWDENAKKRGGLGIFVSGERKMENPEGVNKVNTTFVTYSYSRVSISSEPKHNLVDGIHGWRN